MHASSEGNKGFQMKYYVYTHSYNGNVFYVGKGCGNRAYRFKEFDRSSKWFEIFKGQQALPDVAIVKTFETENEAFDFERELIFKLKPKANIQGPIEGGFSGLKEFSNNDPAARNTNVMPVRMNQYTKDILAYCAKDMGLTKSAYLRHCVLEDAKRKGVF